MLNIVIAETEVETIPAELHSHQEIKDYCNFRGRDANSCILDANYTPNAVISLDQGAVRGRPEILHICLLNALESDLYKNEQMNLWIHTRNNEVIAVDHRFRIPRNYPRFLGLMEELFEKNQVPPEGPAALSLKKMSLKSLIKSIKPSKTILISKEGKKIKKSTLIKEISKSRNPLVIIGGFSDRDFSETTKNLTKNIYKLSDNQLMSWSVLGAIVYSLC